MNSRYPFILLSLFLICCAATEHNGIEFPCLPPNIKPADIVSAERVGSPPKIIKVTVKEKLIELNAQCKGGKLLDNKGREIRFYRSHCFGAPTAYAMETMRREKEELKALREKYTVIEMTCKPSGKPTP
jgi:hypothetical protein